MFCENCGHQISDTAKFCLRASRWHSAIPRCNSSTCRSSQTRIAPAESLIWQWQHHTNVRNTPETMAAPNADP